MIVRAQIPIRRGVPELPHGRVGIYEFQDLLLLDAPRVSIIRNDGLNRVPVMKSKL